MIRLGLTGSIGMGKSTASRQLARLGLPVHDADAVVHRLLAKGGSAVRHVQAVFPDAVVEGEVDRQRLGALVFGDTSALAKLESILHPLVKRAEHRFLQRARRQRRFAVVLDIPLLFEGGGRRFDAVIVVTCPAFLQEQRVMARSGMTREKLAAIRDRQMPDAEKRRRADIVIPTGIGYRPALRRLCAVLGRLRRPRGADQG
ncbi:dephospho-CoA kinase [Telmatospirillum sp.]|uniref:dephospho-CoA kinase n=1 Tax=Telmatospirillum sp. TaxID=2079197 RepID=UPI002850237D|nr:dephospho-CoA kinase [Telmatospirillum sp.]MDR3439610.1 dephospho-CoA kinase [Telmatospirillum sp.]